MVVSGMLGFRGSAELLDAVFQDLDDDRSGRVHFDEIRAWLASTVTQKAARMVSAGVWLGRDQCCSHSLSSRPWGLQCCQEPNTALLA